MAVLGPDDADERPTDDAEQDDGAGVGDATTSDGGTSDDVLAERPDEAGGGMRHAPPEEPLDRRRLILLLAPLAVMVAMTWAANILFPVIVDDRPLLLELLSSNNKNMINAAAKLPFLTYAVIAFVRLIAPDPFFYELGWHYGDRTLRWLERRTPTMGQLMRQLETWFGRLGWLFVLIFPNNYVCAIAGSARMRRSWFWTLNVVGTIGRILFLWWVGQTFQDWVDDITGWISRYRWPLLAVSIGLFLLTTGREWRAGNSGVQEIMKLEHELDDANEDEPA